MLGWLVFDVDRPGPEGLFAWEDAGLPPPSLATATRHEDGSLGCAHLAYALAAPVATGPRARPRPALYAARIEAAMCAQLRADPGYAGLIVKNPLHEAWHVVSFAGEPYRLGQLAARCDLRAPRPPGTASALGRNCHLFEVGRRWAYAAAPAWHGQPEELWLQAVREQLEAINAGFPEPLPEQEVRATARSIARWTKRRYTGRRAASTAADPALAALPPRERQRLAGRRTAARRRADTLAALAAAYGALAADGSRRPTQRAVAAAAGRSLRTAQACWAQLTGSPAALPAVAG
jgi:hypothetical protein